MDYVLKEDVVVKDCKCNQNSSDFKIPDYLNTSSIAELKQKIICEFQDILQKLNCGIQPDLEFLLEEISVVYGIES